MCVCVSDVFVRVSVSWCMLRDMYMCTLPHLCVYAMATSLYTHVSCVDTLCCVHKHSL